jgi:hypothetical protein
VSSRLESGEIHPPPKSVTRVSWTLWRYCPTLTGSQERTLGGGEEKEKRYLRTVS